ncbi:MAG: Kelch repeat-containing protein [Methanomassiliicoccales archaeon]
MYIRSTFTAALAAAIVLSMLMTAAPVSAEEEWKELSDMPFQTYGFSTAQLPDGRVFFNGGIKEGSTDNSDETWLYDPDTDTWDNRASSPLALTLASAVCMPDGNVYVFCGRDSSSQWDHGVMVYDVEGNSWTTLAFTINLGSVREAAAIDDTRILLAGGTITHPMMPEDKCVIFDTRVGDFFAAEPLPYPLGYGTLVKAGDSMYYIGGFDGVDMELSFNVLRYDISSGQWEEYGRMSEPHLLGDGVLASDGLVHLYGSVAIYYNVEMWQALDLRDCSIEHRPAVPTKAETGAIVSTSDGRVIIFGGENDNTYSREVFSMDLYEKGARLSSAETGPGTSVRVYADFEAVSFDNEGMTATAYLVKDGMTFGSCQMMAVSNGTASGLLEVPVDLEPGEYEIMIADVDTGVGIAGVIQFDPLSLTVTDVPTPTDRLGELEDQLDDLKEQLDGKMDAWVGYVLLGMLVIVLVVLVLQMVRKR